MNNDEEIEDGEERNYDLVGDEEYEELPEVSEREFFETMMDNLGPEPTWEAPRDPSPEGDSVADEEDCLPVHGMRDPWESPGLGDDDDTFAQ